MDLEKPGCCPWSHGGLGQAMMHCDGRTRPEGKGHMLAFYLLVLGKHLKYRNGRMLASTQSYIDYTFVGATRMTQSYIRV